MIVIVICIATARFAGGDSNPSNIKPTVFGPEDCPKNTRPSIALQYRKERRYQFNVLLIYDGLCANKLSI